MTDATHIDVHNAGRRLRGPFYNFIRLFGLPSILIVAILYFSLATSAFLTTENIAGLLQTASISLIMFLGLTWVFTIGEMDVSFVSIAALANMICAGLVIAGYSWPAAVLLAMAAGLGVGLLNGLLVGALGLPSLVTTIATGGMSAALAAAIGLGSSIQIPRSGFLSVLFAQKIWVFNPIVLLALVLLALAWFVEARLRVGHYMFAMASNRRAVMAAGVGVIKLIIVLFLFSSALNGFAGILIAAELSSGQPTIAVSLFLDGLTAVLLGGTMIRLGRPNVLGTAVAVLLIAVLVRGGALLGWNDAIFQSIKGGLLLLGVAVVALAERGQR